MKFGLKFCLVVLVLALGLASCAKATPTPAAKPAATPVAAPTPVATPAAVATPTPAVAPAPTPVPVATPTPLTAPTPVAAPAPTPTPAPMAPLELRFACIWPSPAAAQHKGAMEPFAKAVEERTGGRIKIAFFYGDALGKTTEHYYLVVKGIADLSWVVPQYTTGVFPLTEGVASLPFLFPKGEIGSATMQKLYETGLLDGEWKDVKVLAMTTTSPFHLFLVKKRVLTIADMKGLRIRQPGGMYPDIYKKWGASPVSAPGADILPGMTSGVLDGTQLSLASGQSFQLGPATKYALELGFGTVGHGLVVNLALWKALPPDIQRILQEEGLKFSLNMGRAYDGADVVAKKYFTDGGTEINQPSDPNEWRESVLPLYDIWLADMEKKGLAGKKVLDQVVSILEGMGVRAPRR